MTELHEDAMVPLLKSKGTFRKSAQSLQSLPLGSYMYLNHPNWKLTSLGALVLLPPRALKELDLRDNNLHDVGSALARFEALQELRISGSGGPSSPSPSLLALPHLRRLRRPLLARHGGEELEFLPSPLSLKIDSLRVRLRVFVGNGGTRCTPSLLIPPLQWCTPSIPSHSVLPDAAWSATRMPAPMRRESFSTHGRPMHVCISFSLKRGGPDLRSLY